jgi:hypothetical protein
MATKKSTPKKKTVNKTFIEKVSDQASHLKEEIIESKDHFVELTEHAVASLKAKIHDLTAPAASNEKKAIKSTPKKTTRIAQVKKQAIPVKKLAQKAIKKTPRKNKP